MMAHTFFKKKTLNNFSTNTSYFVLLPIRDKPWHNKTKVPYMAQHLVPVQCFLYPIITFSIVKIRLIHHNSYGNRKLPVHETSPTIHIQSVD